MSIEKKKKINLEEFQSNFDEENDALNDHQQINVVSATKQRTSTNENMYVPIINNLITPRGDQARWQVNIDREDRDFLKAFAKQNSMSDAAATRYIIKWFRNNFR